ncbi:NAD-P-binding protein [Lactarius hatsudake]|nr:NAD-P-binding protein [Lactarius hatsudake]
MSGYKSFAIVGAGIFGSFVVRQFLKDKTAGTVDEVVVLTRQGSKTTIEGDAKVVAVDYSNKESIKNALTGVDVVICTISRTALDLQAGIAAAAKEAGVKLFIPSEFGNVSEGETQGMFGQKAGIQTELKTLDIPFTNFYTGPFASRIRSGHRIFLDLDVKSGKVTIGGNGNKQISFTSRADIARYVSYALTRLPAEQLNNRSFMIAGDNKSFNDIFKGFEVKTGKKVEVTYVPISEFDTRLTANPNDLPALLHKFFATAGPFLMTDNHLYPDWNPSLVLDHVPVS